MREQSTCPRCHKTFTDTKRANRRVYCSRECQKNDWPARFWAKVDQSGGPDACHPWTGGTVGGGYGGFRIVDRKEQAHRIAWKLTNGPIPEGLILRHVVCDNPPCCNPKHLSPGTNADNSQDMVDKGRQNRGETHPSAKLTERDVAEIKRLQRQGLGTAEIAKTLGFPYGRVWWIVTGKHWRHS